MFKKSRMPAVETAFGRVEMRTAPRYPIIQRCFVHPAKASAPEAWRCVAYNISSTGISVTLPSKLPAGTLLTVHAHDLPRSCLLQGRIVRAQQVDFFWFTSCELVKPLSDAELRIWRSGPSDWLNERR